MSAARRALLSTGALLAAAAATRTPEAGRLETAVFRRVNALPRHSYAGVWIVMQCGNAAFAPAAGALALVRGRRTLAVRLLLGGPAAWLAAKAVKVVAGRPRPSDVLPGVRRLGAPQAGLGFVSGHAANATVLSLALAREARTTRGRAAVTVALPATVAAARLYVGAHLPLDVVGGVALGVLADAATEALLVRTGLGRSGGTGAGP